MKVAVAVAARNYDYWHDRWETPANGLVCIRCRAFFRTATAFVAHPCWNQVLAADAQRSRRDEMAAQEARRYAIELENAAPSNEVIEPFQRPLF